MNAALGAVVWKFELRPWSVFIDVPKDAKIISAGAQGDSVVVWAICDPDAPKGRRLVAATPTGAKLGPAFDGARFIGTVQMDNGLVFHVWDGGER